MSCCHQVPSDFPALRSAAIFAFHFPAVCNAERVAAQQGTKPHQRSATRTITMTQCLDASEVHRLAVASTILGMHDQSCPSVQTMACCDLYTHRSKRLFIGTDCVCRFGKSTENELSITSTLETEFMSSMALPVGTSATGSMSESSAPVPIMLFSCAICLFDPQERSLRASILTTPSTMQALSPPTDTPLV